MELRKLRLEDLGNYRFWKLPHHAYHNTNGPYYEKETEEQVDQLISKLKTALKNKEIVLQHKKIISNEANELIGEVSWYWKSKETNWLEIGIVIFDPSFWNKGIGLQALQLWIEELFQEKKDIVRLGLSTWSGNIGMLKLAEKLGMKKEAVYRKARIVNDVFYDSVSFGILREEWEEVQSNKNLS